MSNTDFIRIAYLSKGKTPAEMVEWLGEDLMTEYLEYWKSLKEKQVKKTGELV